MKYWLFRYVTVDGERHYTHKRVAALPDAADIKEYVHDWLADYFGDRTDMDEHGVFWSPDQEVCVKFDSAQEISKEDFDVLHKYL